MSIMPTPAYGKWSDVWLCAFRSNLGFASIGIGAVVLALCSAFMMGLIIRHFRVGDFKANVSKSLNDYVLPAALHAFVVLVGVAFCYTIFSLFQFLWLKTVGAVAYSVLTFLAFIILFGAFSYVASSLTVWFPYMCVKGVYSGGAFAAAFYQSRTKQKYFYVGHAFSAIILIVTAVISYFVADVWYVGWIVETVGFAAAFSFGIVFSTIAYFGENGLPREDRAVSPFKRR